MKNGRPQLKDIDDTMILQAVRDAHASLTRVFADDLFHGITFNPVVRPSPLWHEDERLAKWPKKLLVCKLQTLANIGLVEWGTSRARPWLTDEGERALA